MNCIYIKIGSRGVLGRSIQDDITVMNQFYSKLDCDTEDKQKLHSFQNELALELAFRKAVPLSHKKKLQGSYAVPPNNQGNCSGRPFLPEIQSHQKESLQNSEHLSSFDSIMSEAVIFIFHKHLLPSHNDESYSARECLTFCVLNSSQQARAKPNYFQFFQK